MLWLISPSQYYVLKRLKQNEGEKIKQTVHGWKSIRDHVYSSTATNRSNLASSRRPHLRYKNSRELKLGFFRAEFISFSSLECWSYKFKNWLQKRLKNRGWSGRVEGPISWFIIGRIMNHETGVVWHLVLRADNINVALSLQATVQLLLLVKSTLTFHNELLQF